MEKKYRWIWIRNVNNSTDSVNMQDFWAGHVFWFFDNVTGRVYSVRKDEAGNVVISNDFFENLEKEKAVDVFWNWIKSTAPDLYNLDSFKMCLFDSRISVETFCNHLIDNPKEFLRLSEGELTEYMAKFILSKFGLFSTDALNIVKHWFENCCSTKEPVNGPLDLKKLMYLGMPVKIDPKFISEKYDKNLLERYIKAQERIGDNIASLESDITFMMSVINLTGDKKMFHFCSERLKSSFEMVWFMVNRFSTDVEFVSGLVDEYLKKQNNQCDRIAILQLMANMGFYNYKSLLNAYRCSH